MHDSKINGLTPKEIKESRAVYGENIITKPKTHGFLSSLGSSFSDPIIRILLIALAVNLIFTFNGGGILESMGIALAVLLSTLVSTLSEFSSESAFNKMREEAAQASCTVLRSNRIQKIKVSQIVVNDLVVLSAGEKIHADGIVTKGEITVDQSSLNGETHEELKRAGDKTGDGLFNTESLFCGSYVLSGEAVMRVTRVGEGTIYGKTAMEMAEETRESPMRMRLNHLAKTLSKLGLIAAALVAFADLFKGILIDNGFNWDLIVASCCDLSMLTQNTVHALILAVTVVVVAVPEGLPMMITVVLSSNMARMLKDGVLVRKPVGIETAGSMNILFTDKTGTLTSGKLSLISIIDGGGNVAPHTPPAMKEILTYSALYNSGCSLTEGKIIGGNSTERALLSAALPIPQSLPRRRIREKLPFSSDLKYSAVTLDNGVTYVKGAPEIILACCTSALLSNGSKVPLPLSKIKAQMNIASKQSLRLIAIAISNNPIEKNKPPKELTLVAIACLRDALRSTTRQAVENLKGAGIQVVMLTGDSLQTAAAIANECDITENTQGVYEASQLRGMSDTELKTKLPNIRVIARSLPADKSRLVRLAQEMNMVVGMTGDGVNDAPALKRADVGFAVGSGAEVAKEAGDIVILNDDLATISKAVLYGRTVFKSIRKFIVFQLTMNLCAVGISILGPFLGVEMPITVIQMLWVNMIMDTLAGLAFAGEPPLLEYMKEAPKSRDARVLTKSMLWHILRMGTFTIALSALFLCLPSFKILFSSSKGAFLSAFFTLFILCGLLNAFNARTDKISPLRNLGKNKTFILIIAAAMAIQLFILFFGGKMFRTVPLTANEILMTFALAFSVIPADALCKLLLTLKRKMKK